MTYTTPNLKAAGQNLTVADWNTGVVANMETLAKPPACVAQRTTSQSLSANEAIAFNAADVVDTHDMHDPSTNNTRLTVPTGWGGLWLVTINASGQYVVTRLRINGSTVAATGMRSTTMVVSLTPGDYIEALVTQNDTTVIAAQIAAIWMRVAP